MAKAIVSIKAGHGSPKPTKNNWPDGHCALEPACCMGATRSRAHTQTKPSVHQQNAKAAVTPSGLLLLRPMAGFYAAVDSPYRPFVIIAANGWSGATVADAAKCSKVYNTDLPDVDEEPAQRQTTRGFVSLNN
mgnify:CR=1 FL=1